MSKQIQFLNRIDEKGRFCGLESHLVPSSKQIQQRDTHTFSYRQQREMYQEMGDVMGFSKSNCMYQLQLYGEIRGLLRKKY